MFIIIFMLSLPFAQEELVYSASFGFIEAGEIRLELRSDSLNYIRCEQETKELFSLIFRVKDWYESITDSNFVTKRFEKNILEGNYKGYQLVNFKRDDTLNSYAIYRGEVSSYSDSVPTIQNAKDVIGVIYWLRLQKLSSGDTLTIPLHADKKNYEIKAYVKESVVDGNLCTLVIPDLRGIRAFGTQGGLMLYYDKSKIPVLLKIKCAWGYMQAKLIHREWR